MDCRTWNELYEEYEKATLKRMERRTNRFALMKASDLEKLNVEVAQTLRELRKHEEVHRCHA
jgi:hypothetical protein